MKEADEQLKSSQIHWQEEKISILQETETVTKNLQKLKQDMKEKERVIASQQADMDDMEDRLRGKPRKEGLHRLLLPSTVLTSFCSLEKALM